MPKENLYWDEIIKLAKQHRVGAILCDALRDEDSVPGEIRESLQNVWRQEVVRDTRQQYSLEQICKVLENHQVQLMKDVAVLDNMYELNLTYFKELSMYILAGKKQLQEVRSTKLQEMLQKAQASGLPEDA